MNARTIVTRRVVCLAALCVSLVARVARALDDGEPIVHQPHRLIEENMWRAIRYGLSGGLLDPGTLEVRPARAELERLAEWIAPVGEELAQRFMPLQFILELAAMFFVLGAASWLFARVSWRIDLTEIP